MANIALPTQTGESIQLTKPVDWALHMVTAALKFSSSADSSPSTYTTPDAGRHNVLNVLNWHEAHDEYEWPDFSKLGFDFSQAMRFRRALVNDVFVALQKAGSIRITGEPGVLGTPQSGVVVRGGGKRGGGGGGRRMAERKRRCKREDDSDTEIASEDGGETSFFESEKFLASSMRRLIDLSKYPVWRYTNNATEETEDVEEEFADIIYDSLVEEWDGPRALTLDLELKRKAELWSKQKEKSPELGKKSGGAKHEHTAAMNVPVGH